MTGKALLIILDGFGLRDEEEANAIKAARMPTLSKFAAHLSRTYLETSGLAVGLPEGQMGNSEVGHMNIGAGRVIYQTLTRIDLAIQKGEFFSNPALVAAARKAKESGGALHLLGLVSDGGVHSSQEHLHALLRLAKEQGLEGERVVVHAFTDGRDTSPTGGAAYLAKLEAEMERLGVGAIATVCGRYHAMDRDKRWERTRKAYDAIVKGKGLDARTVAEYVQHSYKAGVTDEFLEPAVIRRDLHVRDGDAVIFFNFRPDRARQLSRAIAEKGFAQWDDPERPAVHLATMTRYEDTFSFPFAFADERPRETLGEVVSGAGLKQMRIAETEKYAHVTYFLNGGDEAPFPGEERRLVQSPKHVATYDHAPEMSAAGVADAAVEAIRAGVDLIVMNFANCDMVAHTGSFDATVKAVETVDACVGKLLAAAKGRYHVFITADHGNAEEMANPDGSPQTAHTTLPVPLYYVGPAARKLRPGILADVAPTMLEAMGLPKPDAMTGGSLFGDEPRPASRDRPKDPRTQGPKF